MKTRILLAGLAACCVAAMAQPAMAQALGHRYWIEVSGYLPGVDTEASVSRPGAPGTTLDFESDLDLEDSKLLPTVSAGARLGARFVVTADYFALDRESSAALGRDIVFDGATYPVGVTVEGAFDSNIYRFTVGYLLLRGETAELGAAIGVHATDFGVGLTGAAQVGGALFQAERRHRTFLAPLPTVGIFGTLDLGSGFAASGRADFLSLSVGDYDGGVLNLQAALAYQVARGVEIGAGWRYVDYDLDVTKEAFTAALDYHFSGPALFVRFGF